jgi:hypothetical protein
MVTGIRFVILNVMLMGFWYVIAEDERTVNRRVGAAVKLIGIYSVPYAI